jgi:selenocysteine lyase/cysteine desulfurase
MKKVYQYMSIISVCKQPFCTFCFRSKRYASSVSFCEALLAAKVVAPAGHFYSRFVLEDSDLMRTGGIVRVAFVHYSTLEEVDAVLKVIKDLHS